MQKHVKAKIKKAPEPPAKKKSGPKKSEGKTLTDFFREEEAAKKAELKKPKPAKSYHDVSVPSSEFTQQLGSNYQPPENEKNGQ